MNTSNTVKFSLDAAKPTPLTTVQRKRLAALAAMPDKTIDFSDIPQQSAPQTWIRPGVLPLMENKKLITLRMDADVLNFFKASGKRYQTRINLALREYMQTHA